MVMIEIKKFDPVFENCLPETALILKSAGLVVHQSVTQITLHGSRGLACSSRPDSDVDLSLLVTFPYPPAVDEELRTCLQEVIEGTLSAWQGTVEVDLAAIFPLHPCKLACFQKPTYDPMFCKIGGKDCFGIYKVQKGFSGFVLNTGIQVACMYPLITVWKR